MNLARTVVIDQDRGGASRLGVVGLFGLAMGWVEAAAVLYLRARVDRLEPYQPNPLPHVDGWGGVELVREMATLVMIAILGWLAGRTWRSRLGFACVAFGVWDLAYYLFLRILSGWPRSLLDWDLLFLIPMPWWGPVLAPALIALLLVTGGAMLGRYDSPSRRLWPGRRSVVCGGLGSLLALGVFMADAARAWHGGPEAVRQVLPDHFGWGWFLPAVGLMAVPVIDLFLQISRDRRRAFERSGVVVTPSC